MSKLFTEEAQFDPSQRAGGILDHVLDESSEITQQKKEIEASVEAELQRKRIVVEESQRVRSRILFITRDQSVFEENSIIQGYFKNLGEVFDEVHVIVLSAVKRSTKTLRLASKVWVYPTSSKYFLSQPFQAYKTAKNQLQFTDGFRPDIVVALDAFESGIAGYFIAKHFKRSFQLHITEDFYTPTFKEEDTHNSWRLQFAGFIMKRAASVRVHTDTLKKKILERYPKIEDLSLLPRYFNIQETLTKAKTTPKENLYPQFAFTVLFVGALDKDSTLFRTIDAVRAVLRTPSIGLVVIGTGSNKEEFKTRAQILGIDSQVLFKPMTSDIVEHMQSADVLMCTDVRSESEEVMMKAAAVGLPMILAHTALRDDLFTDEENSFLCDPEDTACFSEKLVKFLNTNALRTQFAQNARDIVQTRIEEDPALYRLALRDSIEGALYQSEKKKQQTLENLQKSIETENQKKEAKVQKEHDAEQRKKEDKKKSLQKKISKGGIKMKLPEHQ